MVIITMDINPPPDERARLVAALEKYRARPEHEAEQDTVARFISFVRANPGCFYRELEHGHLTASGWVLRADRSAALMLHHRKLDRWLQPGGHADGNTDLESVARKEIEEETQVTDLQLLSEGIFDIDIHPIPARDAVPAHLHYDVRYLYVAPQDCIPRGNDESRGVAWIALGEIARLSRDPSVVRLVKKSGDLVKSPIPL